MGSGPSSFGLPTNPRVEQADEETRAWQKRMEIDTPSLIKLNHGTIRYREPQEHRKPKLPRVLKPHEAPHHGSDRVGKTGYFYHPKLTDFSSNAAYTKEEAAKFHYVQQPPVGAKGRKVFFVVGVGMPEEILPPEEKDDKEETLVENLEGDENADPNATEGDSEKKNEARKEEKEAGKKNEGEKEEGKEGEKGGESKKEEEEQKEGKEKELPVGVREPFKPKVFKGELVPRPKIPKRNELPVYPERIKIITRARDQLYFDVEFTEPVSVDVARTEAREKMFLADTLAAAEKKKEEEMEKEGEEKKKEEEPTTSAQAAAETPGPSQGSTGQKENAGEPGPDSDPGILFKVIEETQPPTVRVVFGEKDLVAQIRQVISSELAVAPNKINLLHDEKYVSSFNPLSSLAPAQVQEGFRYCVILHPM